MYGLQTSASRGARAITLSCKRSPSVYLRWLTFSLTLLSVLFLNAFIAHATTAPAAKTAPTAKADPQSSMFNITPTAANTEKTASDLVKILLKKDLEELQTLHPNTPDIYARTIYLGPNNTERAIIAKVDHLASCGSSGCRIVILMPSTSKADTFRIVFDTVSDQMFMRAVSSKGAYADLLALVGPRIVDGYGAWRWNKASKTYGFAGVLKFKS